MTTFIHQRQHLDAPRADAPDGRLVLSQLPAGRSRIARRALSVKVVLQGEERYVFGGRTHRLSPGQVMIADVGDEMEVGAAHGSEPTGVCLYLPGSVPGSADVLESGPFVLPLVDHPFGDWLRGLGRELADDPKRGARFAGQALTAARAGLSGFVDEAARRASGISSDRPSTRMELLRRVELARAHLHAVQDRIVPLAELSSVAGLSSFHLARTFREVHGAPPASYHRDLRLDLAARLLRQEGAPAGEIALRVGFSDQAGFTRAFARRHGVTPGRIGGRRGV